MADDDTDDLFLFKNALDEVSTEVFLTVASDGQHLMERLEQDTPPCPDFILLDLNMPRKNGFECLAELKQSEKFKGIPVVIFSTSGDSDAVEKAFHSGASRFAKKPRSFKKLKSLIKELLAINWKQNTIYSLKNGFLLSG